MAAASKDAGKSLEDRLVQALNFQARALEAQKKEVAAIEVYTRMIERFPQRPDLAQVRYRIGEILFARGDLKGAREVWAPLKTATNPFYSRLADQKLQQQEWEADYRKYIDRIPAMSEMR
jgi:tetratricopeptide (TPR) repeat protein